MGKKKQQKVKKDELKGKKKLVYQCPSKGLFLYLQCAAKISASWCYIILIYVPSPLLRDHSLHNEQKQFRLMQII